MKHLICLLFISVLLISCGCKSGSELSTENLNEPASTTENVDDPEKEVMEQADQTDSLFASLSRTPCFGKCPIFKMYIYESGTVILEGKQFLDLIGTYRTTITEEQKQAFIDKAIFIGFMDLEEKYDSPITDLPSATTTIRIDGVRKEVYRRADYPRKILQLEQLFDDLLESEKWEKISD